MSMSHETLVVVGASVLEPTRLRITALLDRCELTVSDLTSILRQSQPRVSRHLKVLADAGVIRRTPEGAHAFFRRARSGPAAAFVDLIVGQLEHGDRTLAADEARLEQLRAERASRSEAFFAARAADWEQLRQLHVADVRVEDAVVDHITSRGYRSVLDLGTGTGRILELLGPVVERGVGIDSSPEMLALARQRLEGAGLRHCAVRHGDIRDLGYPADTFDAVVVHQVLHLLDDPEVVIEQAASVVRPGGSVIVVDFAPHRHEELLAEFNHRRLGFDRSSVSRWMQAVSLSAISHETISAESPDTISISIWVGRDRRPNLAARRGEETIS